MEPSATVAVLFCDVVGSTARQVRLGDDQGADEATAGACSPCWRRP